MHYMTRRLRALREIAHGGQLVPTGDEFDCTPVDAGYYLTRQLAAEAAPSVQTAVPEPPPPPSEPARLAESIDSIDADPPAAPVADAADESADDSAVTARRAYRRRT